MSILLIKNGDVYAPEHKGKKDILVINDKIVFIDQNILTSALNVIYKNIKIINASSFPAILTNMSTSMEPVARVDLNIELHPSN